MWVGMKGILGTQAGEADTEIATLRAFPMIHIFFDSILAFQPIVNILRPQSHGIGRVLLGISSLTLREVPNAKIRLSAGVVRIIAD